MVTTARLRALWWRYEGSEPAFRRAMASCLRVIQYGVLDSRVQPRFRPPEGSRKLRSALDLQVGATGFEPVTPSVSSYPRHTTHKAQRLTFWAVRIPPLAALSMRSLHVRTTTYGQEQS